MTAIAEVKTKLGYITIAELRSGPQLSAHKTLGRADKALVSASSRNGEVLQYPFPLGAKSIWCVLRKHKSLQRGGGYEEDGNWDIIDDFPSKAQAQEHVASDKDTVHEILNPFFDGAVSTTETTETTEKAPAKRGRPRKTAEKSKDDEIAELRAQLAAALESKPKRVRKPKSAPKVEVEENSNEDSNEDSNEE